MSNPWGHRCGPAISPARELFISANAVAAYDAAGLKADHAPPREAVQMAISCNTVVCSDLRRSVESARKLGASEPDHVESVFREMVLPYASFPSPRLAPGIWAAFFRACWFLGYSPNGESLCQGRLRAATGASRLRQIAADRGSVLLVGHAVVNGLIARELLATGWQGPGSPGRRHWKFGVYECPDQPQGER